MECRRSTNSCGIKEIEGIGKKAPRTIMAEVLSKLGGNNWGNGAYVTFTAPLKSSKIAELSEYIKKLDIGDVFYPEPARNPNSGNIIGLVVWTPNGDKLKVYREKFEKRRASVYKEGLKLRVVSNTVGHQYRLGSEVTLRAFSGSAIFVKEGETYLSRGDVRIIRKTKA